MNMSVIEKLRSGKLHRIKRARAWATDGPETGPKNEEKETELWKNTPRSAAGSVGNGIDQANNATANKISEVDGTKIRETTASIISARECCDVCGREGMLVAIINVEGTEKPHRVYFGNANQLKKSKGNDKKGPTSQIK